MPFTKKRIQTKPASRINYGLNDVNQAPVDSSRDIQDIIGSYYSFLSQGDEGVSFSMPAPPAVRLAELIMKQIIDQQPVMDSRNALPASFYEKCAELAQMTRLVPKADDAELLTIYLKQTALMLKSAGFIIRSKGRAVPGRSAMPGYAELVQIFWNESLWSDLFPSDPSAAESLWNERSLFRDILLKHDAWNLTDLTNDFFDLTGFGQRGDVILMSFIDFYLLTWLELFGLLTVTENHVSGSVAINLDERGRGILHNL